jgi:RNA polymerase sigma-70 factor (ECF subfamily)
LLLDLKELLALIQTLPSGCQTIFNLYVFEELTHKEISIKLNISESTSKSQLARARQLLQEKLEPQKMNNKKVFETNE